MCARLLLDEKKKKAVADGHYARMATFKAKLPAYSAEAEGILSAVDVGMDCFWWDYGQLRLYLGNNKKALLHGSPAESAEAEMMRSFFGCPGRAGDALDADFNWVVSSELGAGSKAEASILSSCKLGGGCDVKDCMMVAVTAKKVTGSGFLLYNVVDESEEGLEMKEGDVRADVFIPSLGKKISMRTNVKTDSGKSWKIKLEQYGNEYSFEDVYKMNFGVEVDKAVAMAREAHAALATKL